MQKMFSTQLALFVSAAGPDRPALHALDAAESLLDRSALEGLLSPIYGSRTGRPGYPLQTLFRSLLPGVRYGLSDVRLSQCLCRNLPFRRFCRLEFGGGVPDATTLGRFRSRLVKHDLWELLPGEANRQLEEQGVAMTRGRVDIVDATPVEAARSGRARRKDGKRVRNAEAGLHAKRDSRGRMKSACGYPVRAGVDGEGVCAARWRLRATRTTAGSATGCFRATRRHCLRLEPPAAACAPDYLVPQPALALEGRLEFRTRPGAIGENVAQPRKPMAYRSRQGGRAVAIPDVGGMDQRPHGQPAGSGDDMALAALDLLAGVEAPRTAALHRLRRPAVDNAGRRVGRPSPGHAQRHRRTMVDRRPQAAVAPRREIPIHSLPRRNALRQHEPRATAAQDGQDRVDDPAQVDPTLPAGRFARRRFGCARASFSVAGIACLASPLARILRPGGFSPPVGSRRVCMCNRRIATD